jgi:integrase
VTGLAPATLRQHEMIVRVHLEPSLGHRYLTQLTPSDVDAYLDALTLDPQTKRHHRSTLRRALADALRDGLVTRNVAALSRPPRMHKAERTYLTAGQVRRVIEGARDEPYWPLWVLIATTGLRVSEALGLAWSDVDLTAETLTVRYQLARLDGAWVRTRPKTRKSRRTIPLTAEAVAALREQRTRQDAAMGDHPRPIEGLVFTTDTGHPIHSTNVLPSWYRTLARLRLPRVTIHDLRHSAASILLAAGVPLPVIADMLGHSTMRVTADLYAHVGQGLRREAADAMHEALS